MFCRIGAKITKQETPKLIILYFKNVNLLFPNSFSLQHPLGGKKKEKKNNAINIKVLCLFHYSIYSCTESQTHRFQTSHSISSIYYLTETTFKYNWKKQFQNTSMCIKIYFLIFQVLYSESLEMVIFFLGLIASSISSFSCPICSSRKSLSFSSVS